MMLVCTEVIFGNYLGSRPFSEIVQELALVKSNDVKVIL